MKLDAYTVVFLRRPVNAPHLGQAEIDKLQQEHLAFNARMHADGHAILTGPLTGATSRCEGSTSFGRRWKKPAGCCRRMQWSGPGGWRPTCAHG